MTGGFGKAPACPLFDAFRLLGILGINVVLMLGMTFVTTPSEI
jgi:hypothetical protein